LKRSMGFNYFPCLSHQKTFFQPPIL
jgi:hypothetical protein